MSKVEMISPIKLMFIFTVSYLHICLLLTFICQPQINARGTFSGVSKLVQSNEKFESPSRGQMRPRSAFPVQLWSCKCPVCSLSSATFFSFLYFLLISLFRMASNHSAKVLPRVPKNTGKLWCAFRENACIRWALFRHELRAAGSRNSCVQC